MGIVRIGSARDLARRAAAGLQAEPECRLDNLSHAIVDADRSLGTALNAATDRVEATRWLRAADADLARARVLVKFTPEDGTTVDAAVNAVTLAQRTPDVCFTHAR